VHFGELPVPGAHDLSNAGPTQEECVLTPVILSSLLVLSTANCSASRAATPRIAVPETGEEFQLEPASSNLDLLLRILNEEAEGTLREASLLLGRDDGPEERAERRCCGERFRPSDATSMDDDDLSVGCGEWLVERRRDWARSGSIYFRALRASLKDRRPFHLTAVRFDREAGVFLVEVWDRDDHVALRVEHVRSVAMSDLRLLRILDPAGSAELDLIANPAIPWGFVCRPETSPEAPKTR